MILEYITDGEGRGYVFILKNEKNNLKITFRNLAPF